MDTTELTSFLKKYLNSRIKFEGVNLEGNALKVRHMNFDIFDQNKINNVVSSLNNLKN